MSKSDQEIREKVQSLLVNAGVQERDAGYLANLYAQSEKGKEHQKDDPDVRVLSTNCAGIGLLPIG